MSALDQKQTCAAQKVMSALPPKADMCGATQEMSAFCQERTCAYSITSSARASSERRGNREAKRLGGLHIEHGLVFRSNFARSSAAISLAKA